MNSHTAVLFPGQGSQTSGMAAVAAAERPDLLELAREELGADPFERIAEGTHFAQPALYCASLAHWQRAGSPTGAMLAGHSLGELAALVAGGALGAEQGLRLAVVRGRLMEEAAAERPGGMLAALGGEERTVREIAARFELTVANENAPGQLVLSGASEGIGEARKELRANGAKAIRLPVAGAFHSPLMSGAATAFRAALDEVEFRAPELPVYSSTAAAPFEEIPARLAAALTEPVIWCQTLAAMQAAGASTFLESGPGDVLTGLVRRTLPEAEARSLAETEKEASVPESAALPRETAIPARTRTGAAIAGLGSAVPETVVTNAPIADRFGVDERWIVQRTGIHSRHYAAPGDRLFELAAAAGEAALADAGLAATDLDLIVVATTSNDELMPATASRVGAALGAGMAGGFDVNAACTGFVAGLNVVTGLIESGRATNVLLIGADFMSRLTDPDDRATVTVFADGAGAVVLRGTAGAGRIGPVVLGSDGENAELIFVRRDKQVIEMQGHETFRHAVDRLSSATGEALAAAGFAQEEIDLFVYHQANARILRSVGERLELPPERVVDCIAELGNTSAATIPLALAEARREGRLEPGARVLLGAFGAGLNWGATVIEWGAE